MALVALAIPSALAILLAGVVIFLALRRGRGDEQGHDGPSDDEGGSKTPPLGPPPPSAPTGCEPDWWPEFEREFAAYAARDQIPPGTAVR